MANDCQKEMTIYFRYIRKILKKVIKTLVTKEFIQTYVSHNEVLHIYENKHKYFSSNNDLHSGTLECTLLKYERKKGF